MNFNLPSGLAPFVGSRTILFYLHSTYLPDNPRIRTVERSSDMWYDIDKQKFVEDIDMVNFKERAKQLKTNIPALILSLKSMDTPLVAKILAGITVAYVLSPVDLIPDFIPVLGYLDDLIIVPALIALTIRLIPVETFTRFRKEAEGMWQSIMPKTWHYAIPIVVIWLLIIGLIDLTFKF